VLCVFFIESTRVYKYLLDIQHILWRIQLRLMAPWRALTLLPTQVLLTLVTPPLSVEGNLLSNGSVASPRGPAMQLSCFQATHRVPGSLG